MKIQKGDVDVVNEPNIFDNVKSVICFFCIMRSSVNWFDLKLWLI